MNIEVIYKSNNVTKEFEIENILMLRRDIAKVYGIHPENITLHRVCAGNYDKSPITSIKNFENGMSIMVRMVDEEAESLLKDSEQAKSPERDDSLQSTQSDENLVKDSEGSNAYSEEPLNESQAPSRMCENEGLDQRLNPNFSNGVGADLQNETHVLKNKNVTKVKFKRNKINFIIQVDEKFKILSEFYGIESKKPIHSKKVSENLDLANKLGTFISEIKSDKEQVYSDRELKKLAKSVLYLCSNQNNMIQSKYHAGKLVFPSAISKIKKKFLSIFKRKSEKELKCTSLAECVSELGPDLPKKRSVLEKIHLLFPLRYKKEDEELFDSFLSTHCENLFIDLNILEDRMDFLKTKNKNHLALSNEKMKYLVYCTEQWGQEDFEKFVEQHEAIYYSERD